MDKKTIISILILLIFVSGLIFWGRTQAKPNQEILGVKSGDESFLTTGEELYDFGTISMKNGDISKIFKITNETESDILLESLTTSCMCTTAFIIDGENKKGPFGMPGHGGPVPKANETILAGETKDIEVVFNPAAHGPAGVGPIDRFIFIKADDGRALTLEIKALVRP